jgi:hypothetical protein
MTINVFEPQVTEIYGYIIERRIAFFSVVTEWRILLGGDADYGFRLWGECAEAGKGNTIGLDGILLSDALAKTDLATNLGQAVALHIWQQTTEESDTFRATLILECIFRSMNICFTSEHLGDEKRYVFDHCPLCAAIGRVGSREIDLAHRALYALLTSAILFIESKLSLRLPANLKAKHDFALVS